MLKRLLFSIDQLQPLDRGRWLAVIALLKGILFALLAFYFAKNWEAEKIVSGIAIHSGDTNSYLRPILDVIKGNGYTSICRMPGLLPIYAPLALLFGNTAGEAALVVVQFFLAVIAVYTLAKWTFDISGSKRAFLAVLILASLSTFTGVWDHYIYMESLSVSALIIGLYQVKQFLANNQWSYLWQAAILLAWCVFLRPILIMVFPVVLVYVLAHFYGKTSFVSKVKRLVVLIFPLLLSIGIWSAYSKNRTGERIILQGSFEQCYRQMPEHHLHVRDLMIAWGGDFQEWSENTEFAWFIRKKENKTFVFPDRIYTSAYNLDSLKVLRQQYQLAANDTLTAEQRGIAMAKVIDASDRFLASFKKEKPFDYWVKNRILLLKKFIVPGHVDNLPFVSVNQMSADQFLIKLWSVILFHLVLVLGTLSALYLFFTQMKHYWLLAGFALATIFLLGPVLGFIEQRYLVPAYPLLLVCLVNFISSFFGRWKFFQAK
ncbi:MAG: hypothetical protein RLZZ77_1051 [Bacteroidota bacterium]